MARRGELILISYFTLAKNIQGVILIYLINVFINNLYKILK